MKALGIQNRCRVFQIPQDVKYIMAPPRMKLYIDYSANIYSIYLKYISKEDIHVYSIDEAYMDVTDYLSMYQMTAKELAMQIMEDIKSSTGITATAGIGTNLYLAKIALDITAKHVQDNIGCLDEELYRETLWNHSITAEYFRNREYVQVTGMVSKMDIDSRVLIIVDTKIAFDDISDLQGERFQEQ